MAILNPIELTFKISYGSMALDAKVSRRMPSPVVYILISFLLLG